MFINHYDILNVDRDADLEQITAAWKRLLKKYHPDLNQEDQDANEQTILVNKAFEVLSDPEKRAKFDAQLEEQLSSSVVQDPFQDSSFEADLNQDSSSFGSHEQPTGDSFSSSSFSKTTKSKSQKQRYAAFMSVVGILLGALTAIPIGLYIVWAISGFDPMGIFREKGNDVVVAGEDKDPSDDDSSDSDPSDTDTTKTEVDKGGKGAKPANDKKPDASNGESGTKAPEKITISYAKFGESRQTVRVEKFVEEVANKEGVVTPITTEGLQTTNPVGRFRELLRVTYQIDGKQTGTLTFKNGDKVNIRDAILKHAKENGRPFEKIEITYALFGKQRNKVRCEEQIAAIASQIDTVVPITTHGLSLRNPSGIVRHTLDIKYQVAGKTGEFTLKYGQNVDMRKTILEHAKVEDGSYVPSPIKSVAEIPKKADDGKGTNKAATPPAKQVAKADPQKNKEQKKADEQKKAEEPKTVSQPPVLPADKRLPIPPENDVESAKAKLTEIFKTDYDYAKRAKGMDELALLNKLATQIIKLIEKESDPTTLYAIFELAIDISRESFYTDQIFDYVHQMELRFQIDGLRKRLEILKFLRRELTLAIPNKSLLKRINLQMQGLSKLLLIQAVEGRRWQDAIDVSDVYRGFCSALGEREKATVLKQATNLLKKRLNTSIKVTRYLIELDSNSTDTEKMLPIGTYLCFTTQQWDRGLKYLAKCDDSKLSAAASADLSVNDSNYLLVGDLWWELALDENYYYYRLPIISRAKYYYSLALNKSTGIDRTKIDKRIKDANNAIWRDGFFFDFLNNFQSPSTGVKLIHVRSGSFQMGEHQKNIEAFGKYASRYKHEGPRHPVTISRSYYLSQYEITQEQWTKVMGTRPWANDKDGIATQGAYFPAVVITWNDAQEFCKRLSSLDKRKYRLPSEAEWEFACRAGTETRYYTGNSDKTVFPHDWVRENAEEAYGFRGGQRVGTKLPNPFGIYDLHGNVYEWCEDTYQADFYSRSPKVDPVNRAKIESKTCRGGSINGKSWIGRSASRHPVATLNKNGRIGFRIVMEE